MTSRRPAALGAVRQVALSVGAVVGAACILLTLAALVFDLRPLVFRSGSMSPTIGTGALAIARSEPASALAVGQVVSVPTASGERVTHRVVQVQMQGDRAVLWLKGDANKAPDASPYVVDHADKVLVSVPWVGYLIGWLTGPIGLFALGLYAAFLVSVIARGPERPHGPTGPAGPAPPRQAGGRRRRGRGDREPGARTVDSVRRVVVPALVLSFAGGVFAQLWALPTLAAWSDTATVAGTTQAAYAVPAPPNTSCAPSPGGTSSSRGVDLTWPTVPDVPLSYTASVSTISATTAVTTVGSNQQLEVLYDPSAQGFPTNTIVTVTARAYPTAASSWLSPAATWKFMTAKNGNVDPICQELVAPTVGITAPSATSESASTKRTAIKSLCGNKFIVCGTATDDSSITDVSFTLQLGTQCWNETTRSYGATCGVWQPTTGGASWTDSNGVNNLVNTAYPSTGTYTLTVRATDGWGNVGTMTRTFTLT